MWFNQNQINEENHKVMFDILVAEPAAVFADRKAHAMAAGLVIGSRIFGIEGLDWISTFYTDWHDS